MDDVILSLSGILVPIGICVVLPIMVTWIVMKSKRDAAKEKFSLLQKAIEHGVEIDPQLLMDKNSNTSLKMRLLSKLQWGIVLIVIGLAAVFLMTFVKGWAANKELTYIAILSLAVGLSFLVTYFIGRKQLRHEIALEEQEAENKVNR